MSTYGPPILNPSLENYGTPAAPPGPPTPNTPLSPFTVLRTVWLTAASNGGTGSGQSYDPYQVGTAATFDALFATIPSFTRIYFAPGTYLTTTGLLLKDGQMIEGAGVDVTTIRLTTNAFTGSGQNLPVIWYLPGAADGTFNSVRNLTVDCNVANQSGVTGVSTGNIDAIALQTLNGLIEDVKVLGHYANPGEGFPIRIFCQAVGTKSATNPAIAHVRRVEYIGNGATTTGFIAASLISCFDQTAPDGTTFTNQWMTGSITECTVVNQPGAIAFGAGGWNGFVIANNKTQNVGTFLIQDTHKGWNVTVADNVAEDFGGNSAGSAQFFALANGNAANQYKNYKFLRNTSRAKSGAVQPVHFKLASPDMSDLLIEEHIADANGFNAAGNQGWLFNVNVLDGMLRNNRVSPTYTIGSGVANSIINVKYENNTCFDGTPLSDVTLGYAQRGTPFLIIKSLLGANLKLGTNQNIFTVPTGQTFVLTDFYICATSVVALSVAGTAFINVNGGAQMSDGSSTGTGLTSGGVITGTRTAAATQKVPALAGQIVALIMSPAVTATTLLADVYVVGFYR